MEALRLFVLVTFPDIQELQEKEGFQENSHLVNDEEGIEAYGSSAYFVDKDWYDSLDF